ncbi:hypothetical protein [Sphingomonas sp. KR3-1]|uniref:hypothetical protein n=1 Tax=Sphingomonas sp. KR3-1 TaxID=3156611 RepID=UPI0032B3FA96
MAGLAITALLGWFAWERLPRAGRPSTVVTGTVRDMRRGWQPQSKYLLVRKPLAEIDVTLPGGGTELLAGDIGLLDQCRRGGPIRLLRQQTNSGWTDWALMANPCPQRANGSSQPDSPVRKSL